MANTAKHQTLALASIGIDIGKDVFHLVGFDPDGQIVLRRKIKRLALVSEFEKLPPCIVGMEACRMACCPGGPGVALLSVPAPARGASIR